MLFGSGVRDVYGLRFGGIRRQDGEVTRREPPAKGTPVPPTSGEHSHAGSSTPAARRGSFGSPGGRWHERSRQRSCGVLGEPLVKGASVPGQAVSTAQLRFLRRKPREGRFGTPSVVATANREAFDASCASHRQRVLRLPEQVKRTASCEVIDASDRQRALRHSVRVADNGESRGLRREPQAKGASAPRVGGEQQLVASLRREPQVLMLWHWNGGEHSSAARSSTRAVQAGSFGPLTSSERRFGCEAL